MTAHPGDNSNAPVKWGQYKVIGFDLRKEPILDLGGPRRLGEHCPTDGPVWRAFPPTVTTATWPRSAAVTSMKHPFINGLNFLWLPDAKSADPDAVAVAFSLRAPDAAAFEKSSWILPIDENFLVASLGWRLLGHDVADASIGYSGFYGFTWKPGELARRFAGVDLVFNRNGLIDDEAVAVRVAELFTQDPGTNSHGPFHPVRVWVQGFGVPGEAV